MNVRRDLFGRTEAEVARRVEFQRGALAVADGYSGNEGIAINKERRRAALRVDERCLAELRGDPVTHDQPIIALSGEALAKWRRQITRRGAS